MLRSVLLADRTSAYLFSEIFNYLAAQETLDKEFALSMWQQTFEYDFNKYQMYCDEALTKLGLLKDEYYADYEGKFS